MKIVLYRTLQDKYGTHGRMEDEAGKVSCYTIERPWLNNQHDVSCIPDGTYTCVPHVKSTNGQLCWRLLNVLNRSGILIHTGNTEDDSEGCIIIGLMYNDTGVLESEMALEQLHKILPSNFELEITSVLNQVVGEVS
jgi:hypothetical protein